MALPENHAEMPQTGALSGSPRWSVMVPTRNRVKFLEEALKSVLVQDLGEDEMQITVIDDASDQPGNAELIEGLSGARIEYHRLPDRLGYIAVHNKCLELARGDYVHILNDDDLVDPGFYQAAQEILDNNPNVAACYFHWRPIESDGRPAEPADVPYVIKDGVVDDWWFPTCLERNLIQAPSGMVVRRRVYEELGLFDKRILQGSDWDYWLRIFARYSIWCSSKVLYSYRLHGGQITNDQSRHGKYWLDSCRIRQSSIRHFRGERKRECKRFFHGDLWALCILYREQIRRRDWHRLASELRRLDPLLALQILWIFIVRGLPKAANRLRSLLVTR